MVVRRRAFNVDCDGVKAPAGRQGRQACCTVVSAQPVPVITRMKVLGKYIKKAIDSGASVAKIIDANKIVTAPI